MVMRDTSKEAEDWCNDMGITSRREQRLLFVLAELGKPANRSELAIASGLRINCVCRPIKNLVDGGTLVELDAVRDPRSGRKAHPLWFKRKLNNQPYQGSLL